VGHDLSARAKGRHLAVADVGQPSGPGDRADFGHLRQGERVIGRLASHDRGCQRQAERLEHCPSDLPLRQIGTMSLAGSELAHPCGRYGGHRRRRVDADHAPLQVVDTGAFGDSYAFRSRCRWRANTRSKVPLYLAQRSANISLPLHSYHHAPERLSRT
jgi:hypothetical protein